MRQNCLRTKILSFQFIRNWMKTALTYIFSLNGNSFHFQVKNVTNRNTSLKIRMKPTNDGQVLNGSLFTVYKKPLPLSLVVIKCRVAQLFPI